ncbi:MAG: 50S ribosomal protein L4 [Candidatus Auribacterota bacterium]|nr:50S ribosomal protein L4 [Candidatus Auribacterota bacterium]
MKLINIDGKEKGDVDLPLQFKEEVRKDLIKKAVEVIQANNKQPYGAKIGAGMRASANLSKRRHKYRGCYGHGISRVPRKILSRKGTRMNWAGAVAPGTVGGRRAHPPKAEKNIAKSINIKEKKKAIRSALAASIDKELVKERNHAVPDNYPFVVSDDIEKIDKTKDVKKVLLKEVCYDFWVIQKKEGRGGIG